MWVIILLYLFYRANKTSNTIYSVFISCFVGIAFLVFPGIFCLVSWKQNKKWNKNVQKRIAFRKYVQKYSPYKLQYVRITLKILFKNRVNIYRSITSLDSIYSLYKVKVKLLPLLITEIAFTGVYPFNLFFFFLFFLLLTFLCVCGAELDNSQIHKKCFLKMLCLFSVQ